ncbi:DUF2147 domain-containing protein [Hansschlegelia sp. KR7-227]|uniref:DUF2147 domain-containing protein n=1 Tax=Hansschlegelia sp. KR7-227 TaxID=3400914 RepID=UPI003C0D716B
MSQKGAFAMIRAFFAAAAVVALAAPVFAAPAPTGVWSMPNGKAQVRIADCGGALCATLVALKKPTDKQGRPKVDKHNPNPALRSRPVIGVSLVRARPDGADWAGDFYNPDDGRTYAGRIMADGADRLKLRGCVLGLVCKTQVLTRVD